MLRDESFDAGAASGAQVERDYYRSLLALSQHDEPRSMLEEALRLLVGVTGAREGYVELYDDEESRTVGWSASVGVDEARTAQIRSVISRGIVAEAVATGEVVVTSSAIHDPRFNEFESVRSNGIEGVICAPIERGTPIGVVYLQGKRADVEFPAPHVVVRHAEFFAASIAPLAENLIRAERAQRTTPLLAREELSPAGFESVVGRSPALRDVVRRLRFAAPLDVHVLLTGPTGSGKTMLAQSIHAGSPRHARPFVDLNCAALPENLLENELFGADPGAHSAVPRGGVRGKVEAAEGGTLFLDEVAELSLAAQAKLLQLLQAKTYYRLGGREPRKANVRLVAATNADLAAAVAAHRFREDLYYRLKVLEVRVPALRERPEDLVPLAAHFCRVACRKHELPDVRLSPAALRAVTLLEWPGNVRELENRMEAAVIDASMRGVDRIEAIDLTGHPGNEGAGGDGAVTFQEATRRFQRQLLVATLQETDWNVMEAARRLDLARSHLYSLIRLHGIGRD